jgi:hypothetical protein
MEHELVETFHYQIRNGSVDKNRNQDHASMNLLRDSHMPLN